MPRIIATHEVDDVDHWIASPKRAEAFEGIATDVRTYVDPTRPNQVGLSADISDLAAFQAMMESEAGAEAMKHDGVRPETLVILFEA